VRQGVGKAGATGTRLVALHTGGSRYAADLHVLLRRRIRPSARDNERCEAANEARFIDSGLHEARRRCLTSAPSQLVRPPRFLVSASTARLPLPFRAERQVAYKRKNGGPTYEVVDACITVLADAEFQITLAQIRGQAYVAGLDVQPYLDLDPEINGAIRSMRAAVGRLAVRAPDETALQDAFIRGWPAPP
jgi:hypothetical protein